MGRLSGTSKYIHAPRTLLQSLFIGVVLGGLMLGLISATSYLADRMQHSSVAQTADKGGVTATGAPNPVSLPTTTMTSKSKLQTVVDPAADTTADKSTSAAKPNAHASCNAAQRLVIVRAFKTSLATENSLHKKKLAAIQRTGLVTQLLNPDMFSLRLSSENLRHSQTLQNLTKTEISRLSAVHCAFD